MTRGTTGANRLRRFDRWTVATLAALLRSAADPLVVDLGFGARPVTTAELAHRLRARQRWIVALADARERGLTVVDGPRRWRLGEVTLDWAAVAPVSGVGSAAGRRHGPPTPPLGR